MICSNSSFQYWYQMTFIGQNGRACAITQSSCASNKKLNFPWFAAHFTCFGSKLLILIQDDTDFLRFPVHNRILMQNMVVVAKEILLGSCSQKYRCVSVLLQNVHRAPLRPQLWEKRQISCAVIAARTVEQIPLIPLQLYITPVRGHILLLNAALGLGLVE